MEWIEKWNQALAYLEEHLTEEADYEKLGKLACCSPYHFQRMFTYLAGIPLSEYIRRRRMSLAAVELQSGECKIVDVALKYGYQSPTAFNRAFQSVHGIAPSLVKSEGVEVKSFPPITFQMAVKGVQALNYRIEKKEAFRITGLATRLTNSIEENFLAVPSLWQEAVAAGVMPRLLGMMDSEPKGILGVSTCNEKEQWQYWIAVASTESGEVRGLDSGGSETEIERTLHKICEEE